MNRSRPVIATLIGRFALPAAIGALAGWLAAGPQPAPLINTRLLSASPLPAELANLAPIGTPSICHGLFSLPRQPIAAPTAPAQRINVAPDE